MSVKKLREMLKSNKPVFGTEKTLKNLKKGIVKTVFLSKNCPFMTKEIIKKYKVEIIELNEDNDEIALVCKRPHFISVISF